METISTALATAPVAATHGERCACRHCANGAYLKLLTKSDYQQHEIARLERELAAARHAAAIADFKRLTVVIQTAVAAGDRECWAAAVAERLALSVSDVEAAELVEAGRESESTLRQAEKVIKAALAWRNDICDRTERTLFEAADYYEDIKFAREAA